MTEAGSNCDLPTGWRHIATVPVGGLTEIGFGPGEGYLLVVSWAGRGLIDTNTGERVARDRQEPTSVSTWIDEVARTVEAIGPLSGTVVHCVGLWGGTLPERADDWRLESEASGSREYFFLIEEHTGRSWRLTWTVTEVRAYGFSNSGRIMVIATSSDVGLYGRTTR